MGVIIMDSEELEQRVKALFDQLWKLMTADPVDMGAVYALLRPTSQSEMLGLIQVCQSAKDRLDGTSELAKVLDDMRIE